MRKQTTFQIKDRNKDYIVRELSTREWIQFLGDANIEELDLLSLFNRLRSTFLKKASNVSAEEALDLYPSEIEELWEKFKEVNSVFFGLPGRLGVIGLWDQIKPAVYGACGSYVVEWLRRVMLEPQTTVSAISSMPSKSTNESSKSSSSSQPTQHELEPTQTKKAGRSSLEAAGSSQRQNPQP